MFRRFLSYALLVCTAIPSRAQDLGAVMLEVTGKAWVNGSSVPNAIAVLPGDQIQTGAGTAAHLKPEQSDAIIAPESLARFEKGVIELQHGGVAIVTDNQLAVHVSCVKIRPIDPTPTKYQVDDVDGRVHVNASKGAVMVEYASDRTKVEEGKNITVDENGCAARVPKRAAVEPGFPGNILDSPWAMRTGIAAVAGITIWVLLQDDDPASTWSPRRTR